MGVSGSGKSTVGAAIAEALHVSFIDGDALHPPANIEKMAAGIPLSDSDRWPWLALVGVALAENRDRGVVVACSALKRSYRDAIRARAPGTRFVLLTGSRTLLAERMNHRPGHFMPSSLLDSQLATLEPLAADEPGVVVDIAGDPETVVADALRKLSGSEGVDRALPTS